jgi:hypothetical protein
MRVYRELLGRKVYDGKCGKCQKMYELDAGPYEE